MIKKSSYRNKWVDKQNEAKVVRKIVSIIPLSYFTWGYYFWRRLSLYKQPLENVRPGK